MPLRSSTRDTPRKRYTVDAFEGIEELQDTASTGADSPPRIHDDESDGDDFNVAAEADPDDEDAMTESDIIMEEPSENESDSGERNLDNISIASDHDAPIRNSSGGGKVYPIDHQFKRPHKVFRPDEEKTYTRGISETFAKDASKSSRQLYQFGPAAKDWTPVHKAFNKWANDPVLPSRKADKRDLGGFHPSFYVTNDDCPPVDVDGWMWYGTSGGREAMANAQCFEMLSEDAAREYRTTDARVACVAGPFNKQRKVSLAVAQSVPLSDFWETDASEPSSIGDGESYKSGFLVNLGGKVTCLDWAPSENGPDQYLAASTSPEQQPTATVSAFTPQPPSKSLVQLYRFSASDRGHFDRRVAPELQLCLCSEWGDVKILKWCPMVCDASIKTMAGSLGLLAGIWGDGAVRVLDVPRTSASKSLRMKKAAFECKPPNTLCTSLTWLSPTRIAVGCANGFVAAWDLPDALQTSTKNPRPTIFTSITTGFILNITSCWPSRPNILLTTSMTGYMTMTDLTQPHHMLSTPVATASGSRTRHPNSTLLWNDYCQSALYVDEQSYTVRASALRRWFAMLSVGRLRGSCTLLAGSPCHPHVLCGTVSGEVVALNPIGRILHGKYNVWQLDWLSHEWRRLTEEEVSKDGQEDEDNVMPELPTSDHDVDQETVRTGIFHGDGLSRITEGFKPERMLLDTKDSSVHNIKDGVQFTTIHEPKSAVTALSWNPNIHVGGWAAAGMADGLLRVEDIAI